MTYTVASINKIFQRREPIKVKNKEQENHASNCQLQSCVLSHTLQSSAPGFFPISK